MAVDAIILIATYAALAWGQIPTTRTDRTAVALLGAAAVLVCGRLEFAQAIQTIDFDTLTLLISLMVVNAGLVVGGFYDWLIARTLRAAERPYRLLALLIALSAVLSAFFANDVVCMVFAPVLCTALGAARRNPLPYLMALATSANIGSAATLIGNPQNMLIAGTAHLPFLPYTLKVLPLVVLCLVLDYAVVAWVYRDDLAAPAVAPAAAHEFEIRRGAIAKSLLVACGLLVALVLGWHREVAALAAASVLLVSRQTYSRDMVAQVDWNLILLFVGLFIVTGDVQQHGVLVPAMHALERHHVDLTRLGPLAAVACTLSNLVSNVPAVLLLKPFVPLGAGTLWSFLAVVTTFAGNLTLLGSIANLIVAEQARRAGVVVGFAEHLRVGVPLALLTLLAAWGWFTLFAA